LKGRGGAKDEEDGGKEGGVEGGVEGGGGVEGVMEDIGEGDEADEELKAHSQTSLAPARGSDGSAR
jgi:hypothetical protein